VGFRFIGIGGGQAFSCEGSYRGGFGAFGPRIGDDPGFDAMIGPKFTGLRFYNW
jgi:hypothetical protein